MTVRRFTTDTTDPWDRGRAIGTAFAADIDLNLLLYRRLFSAVGVTPEDVPDLGAAAVESIGAWSPDLGRELHGIAAGAGRAPWELGLLNARTEVLATVGATGEGECSTSVVLPPEGPPITLQTWDWHDESNPDTQVVRHRTAAGMRVRSFAEFGMLGKIGLNSEGLGVHFNILNHAADGDGVGVPVHAVAREILDRAREPEEAVAIARSAPVTASTVLTVVSFRNGVADAVCIELSAGGTALVRPRDGMLVHTNHFLDSVLARGELVPPASNSYPRLRMLAANREKLTAEDVAKRVEGMAAHTEDGAPLCCHADPAHLFQDRWQTLMTIALDLGEGAVWLHEGTPCTATPASWQVF
ncbi:C45 family autoproteolytic acyltransferase/hydolase [Nocardiopsis oceani]